MYERCNCHVLAICCREATTRQQTRCGGN